MKPAREYLNELTQIPADPAIQLLTGRGGQPTIKCGNIFLHSNYHPREEAARLVQSAQLDPRRPVIIIGAGLGYHLRELLAQEFEIAVIEPNPAVAKLALEHLQQDSDFLLAIGDPDKLTTDQTFIDYACRVPQILVHPPTQRVHESWVSRIEKLIVHTALDSQRLRIAIVGPLYGGSLPIAGYLDRAFRSLGHVSLLVDNSPAWSLYNTVAQSVRNKKTGGQLADMFTHFLNEWSYARVAEFLPDICIVMAQAPVDAAFPARLQKEGVVTAFWYVENWRHFSYWKTIAPHYDCFFHIQPGQFDEELAKIGCPFHAYVPTACDPEVHKPVSLDAGDSPEFSCDISFAGAGYPNRVALFKGLTDYNFKIWGVDWHAYELQPLVQRPDERFSAEDFTKIVTGSRINLNLHASVTAEGVDPNADAVNPRVFEIAACGGFQLCDPCVNLDALFSEFEIPIYRSLPELRTKIDYFLERPGERETLARHARERVLREHTYAHRAQRMLDLMLSEYGARLLRKGLRIQCTVAEMAQKVGRDSPLGQYLATLPLDMLFTHENINGHLPPPGSPASHPEQVFNYLREIRNFAENLLETR